MDAPKILVVDDEIDATKIMTARLQKCGFDAEAVYNGKEALEYVKKKTPDLILLDLFMPEMDGYEVSKNLRANKRTSEIPIIMITVEVSQKDKIKALKMGIDDYITKPYDLEELIARMEAILRRARYEIKELAPKGINLEDEKRIKFLGSLIDKKITKIDPEYDMTAKSGYRYKLVADFFQIKDHTELDVLNYLAEKQALETTFFDRILVCPFCNHHDINVRETNPSDHSPNIRLAEMFHHYRCGYVGSEDEYLQGVKYVCPKCHKELRHIGVDYDKPGKIYISNTTQEKFTEPDIYCQCRNCQKFFDVDDAVRQDICSFMPTDRAREIVERGMFVEYREEQASLDPESNVYTLRHFRNIFGEEVKRSETFNRPLSLVLADITNFDKVLQDKGEVVAKRMLNDLIQNIKESLSSVDVPARYDTNSIISLLLEANKERARQVVAALKQKEVPGLDVEIRSVSFPEDANSEEGLLEKLIKSKVL